MSLRPMFLIAFLVFPSTVLAHRDDQYLQATLVAIDPSSVRLQINLTPGVAVAEQVIKIIDINGDGVISKNETAAYAEWLKRELKVRLDGRTLALKVIASEFAEPNELRTGSGIIQLEFSATPGPLTVGTHKLTLDNRHLPKISVYLINAARPKSNSVQIVKQKRNDIQSVGEIEFTFYPLQRNAGASGDR